MPCFRFKSASDWDFSFRFSCKTLPISELAVLRFRQLSIQVQAVLRSDPSQKTANSGTGSFMINLSAPELAVFSIAWNTACTWICNVWFFMNCQFMYRHCLPKKLLTGEFAVFFQNCQFTCGQYSTVESEAEIWSWDVEDPLKCLASCTSRQMFWKLSNDKIGLTMSLNHKPNFH